MLGPQDQKDLQKFLKFLSIKAVQIIVQSRLGEKVHTRSKPHAMGQDWFNLAINDMQEITDETKKVMGRKLPSAQQSMCIEISLKTNEGDSMVLENWCLGMNDRQDVHAKITYTVYNRMGMLLKSLLSVTRVTPAYQLARKQGLDYVICYRVYFGDVKVKNLGEGFQTIRVGSVGTPVGSITLSAAYRTNLTMPDREPVMPLKSDHYSLHSQTHRSHDLYMPCPTAARAHMDLASGDKVDIAKEIASATATEVTESTSSSRYTQPTPSHAQNHSPTNWKMNTNSRPSSMPQAFNLNSSHHAKGAFASSPVRQDMPSLPALSSTPPFASLLRDCDSSPKTPRSDSSGRSSGSSQRKSSTSFQRKDSSTESVDGRPPMSNPTVGLWGTEDDFVMVELKPAFASKSAANGDLGSFFRECQSAPPLNLFQQSRDLTLDNIMDGLDTQLSTYQDCLPIFDELVANLQQSQIS